MRILALSLQLTGMALMPPALLFGVLYEHGMRMEMTLLLLGGLLFTAGRVIEPESR
jgi:hypothetical protein